MTPSHLRSLADRVSGATRRVRRKLASLVAGEQPMLSLPSVDGAMLRGGNWGGMSDASIAATVRYGLATLTKLTREKAEAKNVPMSVMVTSTAAMDLIRHARDANATSLVINQSGEIAGEDVGAWRIEVSKLPDDFEFGEPGIQEEIRDERGKLIRLAYGIHIGARATLAQERAR